MFESHLKQPISFPSLTGSIVTFNSQYADLPLKSHTVDIDYTGNAISNCFVVNMADDTNISYFQGLLNGTYGFVDLGTIYWGYSPADQRFYNNTLDFKRPASSSDVANAICSIYPITNLATLTDNSMCLYTNGYSYVIDFDYTDTATFKTAMNGVYLIYELATPTTPTITEAQFNTLLSAFNISGEVFKVPFDTPIYGGSYNCLTGVVTSNKDSGGGDITPTYQQTATAICETSLGQNNIFADTGDTTLQYIKLG